MRMRMLLADERYEGKQEGFQLGFRLGFQLGVQQGECRIISAMYRNGAKPEDIAAMTDTPLSTILDILKSSGLLV